MEGLRTSNSFSKDFDYYILREGGLTDKIGDVVVDDVMIDNK